MKTLIVLSLTLLCWLLPASHSNAAVVTWGFSGVVERFSNGQGKLPSGIAVGTPFTGVVRYDTTLVAFPGSDANPNTETYNFTNTTGYSVTVYIAGHVISSVNPVQTAYRTISVENDENDKDRISFEEGHVSVRVDGNPIPGPITAGGFVVLLQDPAKTMLANDSLPLAMPQLAVDPELNALILNAYDAGANIFTEISGAITAIYPETRVVLTTQTLPGNQLRLSWPVSATGLTLQFATSLASQNWTTEPTAVVDTATVSTTGQPKFFRLVKLPVTK